MPCDRFFREQVLSLQRQTAELSNQCDVTRDEHERNVAALQKEKEEALSEQKSGLEAARREALVALRADLDSKHQHDVEEVEARLQQEVEQQDVVVKNLKAEVKVSEALKPKNNLSCSSSWTRQSCRSGRSE